MASEESVRVAVRVRPMLGREQLRGAGKCRARCAVAVDAEHSKVTVADALADAIDPDDDSAADGAGPRSEPDAGTLFPKRRHSNSSKARSISCVYDHVFGPETTQEELFESTVKDSVRAVVRGVNCTVFAYGQTGTGKTHTIFGQDPHLAECGKPGSESDNDVDGVGLIPRAVTHLFQALQASTAGSDLDATPDSAEPVSSNAAKGPEDGSQAEAAEAGPSSSKDSPADADAVAESEQPEVDGAETDSASATMVSSEVYCSYLQIYNEHLFDLLQDHKRQFPLKIRQTKQGANYVQGLAEIRVSSLQDVLQVLRRGARNRAVRATELNQASSRSHAILQLRVETEELAAGPVSESRVFRSSKFNFVDLAGSEKWDTSIEMSNKRTTELKQINVSLSTLGNVVQALGDKDRKHVPYRNSKLTHLLQDSLGGNTRTTIICTLSPSADCIEETISTLKFADRAKCVMVRVKVNEVVDDSVLLAHAQAEIARLKRLLQAKDSKHSQKMRADIDTLKQENQALRARVTELRAALAQALAAARAAPAPTIDFVADADAQRVSSSQQSPSREADQANDSAPGHNNKGNNGAQDGQRDGGDDDDDDDDEAYAESFLDESEAESISHAVPELDEIDEDDANQASPDANDEKASQASSDLEDHVQTDTRSDFQPSPLTQPAPSEIVKALKEELENSDTSHFGIWNDDQERAIEQVEQQCFDELSYELEQLRALQRERESLERAMRTLKQRTPRGNGGSSRRKAKHPSLRNSPLVTKNSQSTNSATRHAAAQESAQLSFSAQDIGKGLRLYQCRVDAWYQVDILSFDPKSGMHRVKYREDGSEQWHQMVGRRYEIISSTSAGRLDSKKSLLRDLRHDQAERQARSKVKKALRRSGNADKFSAYGGVELLWKRDQRRSRAKGGPRPPSHAPVPVASLAVLEDQPDAELLERLGLEGLRYESTT